MSYYVHEKCVAMSNLIGTGLGKTVPLVYPMIVFLHSIFMHLLRYHLDFGICEISNLLVSFFCLIPSVHPFFFQVLVGWQPGSSAILLYSHVLQLVLGIPGHLKARCDI